jgi:hypothetical protein
VGEAWSPTKGATTMWENYLHNWQRRAMIRAQEPFNLEAYPEQQHRFHYPRAKLPICLHPLVMARGEETTRFLLLQACYQFMEEIAGIEENIVIDINAKLLDRLYMPYLSESHYQVLRSINIDEYFHSMTSWNYRDQLKALTGCDPIVFKASSTRDAMTQQSKCIEDSEVKAFFEINVLCLVENTITSSLLDYAKDKRCHDAFMNFNMCHIQDEAHHAKFYRELLITAYQHTDVNIQKAVAQLLSTFIRRSLDAYEEKREYNCLLLKYSGFSEEEVETIISETYPEITNGCQFSTLNVAAARNLELLTQIPIYQCSDIKQHFQEYGLSL